jgi:hypothetical protein
VSPHREHRALRVEAVEALRTVCFTPVVGA